MDYPRLVSYRTQKALLLGMLISIFGSFSGYAQTAVSPTHAGSLIDGAGGAILNFPTSVFISGNYVYVVSTSALEIVDVTNPASPAHKGSLTNGTNGALLSSPNSVFVLGNYAYVASSSSNALEIVDVSNPATPIHKGSLSTGSGSYPKSVFVSGNYAYVACSNSNALKIVDVSNPAGPLSKGQIVNGAGVALLSPYSVFVSGNYAYVASAGSKALEIVDVSNPAAPVHKGSLVTGSGGASLDFPVSVFVSGNYAYLVNHATGSLGNALEIVDVSNPAAPTHAGSLINGTGGALLNNPNSVFVLGNYAYVASSASNALEIVDVSNPIAPVHKASLADGTGGAILNTPQSVFVSSNYAYVVSTGSLEVVHVFVDGPAATSATTLGQTSFTANWNAVAGSTGYNVDVSTDNFLTFVGSYHNASTTGTSLNITGLSPGISYQYRVSALVSAGTTLFSNTVSTTTISATPTTLASTALTQTSFTANWNAANGASGYFIDVATDNGFTSILPNYNNKSVTGTSINITGLISGTTYYYQVRSSNASGVSPSSNIVTTPTIPPTPVISAATALAQSSFTANWNAAVGASGYYIDVATDNGFTSILADYNNKSVAGTSLGITGLNPGTTYYYRVRSYNASGSSPSSTSTSALTISATTIATAATSPTQTSFTANWNTATGATQYYIDVATTSGFGASIVPGYDNKAVAGTSYSITGLSNPGTTYYYQVRSSNISGTSPSSNTISIITVPADPTTLAASSVNQTSFTANWNAVTGATGYFIDVATDNGFTSILSNYNNKSVASNSASIIGLTYATTYYYRVRSTNASGTSASSNTISALTIPVTPTSVAATTLTQTSFVANWGTVTGATGYYIDVATDAAFSSLVLTNVSVATNSYNATGLNSGTTYYYRVRSANASGSSPSSNTISALTIPATPTSTNASSLNQTSFNSNWNAATGADGYFIDVATDNGFASILVNYNNKLVTGTSASITGLSPATTYYYRVRSTNTSGTSASSNTISALTIPATPTSGAATTLTQTSFVANWGTVTGAAGYYIDVATDAAFSSLVITNMSVATNSYNATGLNSGTTYYYRVRSANASGSSPSSAVISALTIPANPTAANANSVGQTSFTANWNDVTGATEYRVDVANDNSFASILSSYNNLLVSVNSVSVTGLTVGTNYYYRIRAVNASGTSGNSTVQIALTLPETPIAGPADSNPTTTSFSVNWNSVQSATKYLLDVAIGSDFIQIVIKDLDVGNVTSRIINGLNSGTNYYYRVRAVNSSGTSPYSNTIQVTTIAPANSSVAHDIFFPTGGTVTDYRIISVPQLQGTNLTTGLTDASYQKSWRIQHWNNSQNKNIDIRDITTLTPGNGYWVNSNLNPAPSIHVVGTDQLNTATLTLKPGWNQIGNPFYDFDISWTDVLSQNSSVSGIGNLYTYNVPTVSSSQPFQQYDGLLTWGGGFVNSTNSSDVQLTIPTSVKHFNGRVASPTNFINSTDISSSEWFVPITLQVGNNANNLGGIGMHPDASASIDRFDAIALPRLFTYVDLSSTHAEFFQPHFMRDVVTTSPKYDWSFSTSSNNSSQDALLSWDNISLGNNDSKLFLFDEHSGVLLDMKKNKSYSFQMEGDRSFHIFFSSDGNISPDLTSLVKPYPNPFSSRVNFSFLTSQKNESVQITIYDLTGKLVKTVTDGMFEPGIHEINWDGTDDQQSTVAQGVYIFRFISSAPLAKSGKIIFR